MGITKFLDEMRDVGIFLRKEVPASGTKEWDEWKSACNALGEDADFFLIKALRDGTPQEQYAAILALRQHGHDAWGRNYGPDLHYHVELVIRPKVTDDKPCGTSQ